MIIEFQYELNREWLYDKKDAEKIIGEKIYQRALKDHEIIEEFITYTNEGDYLK